MLIEENLDNWQAFDPFIYEHSPIVYIRNVQCSHKYQQKLFEESLLLCQ